MDPREKLKLEAEASVDGLRDANADFLDHLGATFGDGRFMAAAALLRGGMPGRRPVDDATALQYAETVLRVGMAASIHKACEKAAKLYAPPHQVPAMRDRLRKKLRTKLNNSEDSKSTA